MQSNSGYEPDFPGIDDAPFGDQNETGAEKKRKDFQNTLFPNDSVTMCSGFINELRFHQKSPSCWTWHFLIYQPLLTFRS